MTPVLTTEEVPTVVDEENRSPLRLIGDPDHRQGGTTTTMPGPRDGTGRVGEIAFMTFQDATVQAEATTDSRGSGVPATTTTTTTPKKLAVLCRGSGATRSPDAVRRRRRF